MTDDVLARATRALRQTTREGVDDARAEATCRLVLRKLETHRTFARTRRRLFMLPLIAAVVVTGAWAGATGRLSSLAREALSTGHAETTESEAMRDGTTAPPMKQKSAPTVSRAVYPHEELAAPAPSVAPEPRPSAPPRVIEAPRAVVAPPVPGAQDLYAEAHAAHFKRHDYQAAVAAWDRYLEDARANPDGATFALEARYNRAVALLRLGRREEAHEALRPFARGEYGPYRQSDAQRLLDVPAEPLH